MPQFTYKARQQDGRLLEGTIDAQDRTAAIAVLRSRGLYPVALESKAGTQAVSQITDIRRPFRRAPRPPKLHEIARYLEQLASLLRAGMPLTQALQSLSRLEYKGIPAEVSLQLRQQIMEGKSLSEAMSRQPYIFSDLCVSMVRAGEQSGALTEVLFRLAKHYEQFGQLRQRLISAMVYPAIVLSVGVLVLTFFMTVMLPRFMEIFQGMEIPLPWSTRMVVGISRLFSRYWWLIAAAVVGAWIFYNNWRRSEAGRRKIDKWIMEAPLIGRIVKLSLFAQFARTLSTLLVNGVPVLQALRITEDTMQNSLLREAIRRTRDEVTDGKTISQPLLRSGLFPQLLVDLVRIGEDTGDVPSALNSAAQSFERDLEVTLNVLMDTIGPIMIVLLAIMVGFLVFSILSAMFAITSSIGR